METYDIMTVLSIGIFFNTLTTYAVTSKDTLEIDRVMVLPDEQLN